MALHPRKPLMEAAAVAIAGWAPVRPAYAIRLAEIEDQNGVGWRLPGTPEWPEKVWFSPVELEMVIARARPIRAVVDDPTPEEMAELEEGGGV